MSSDILSSSKGDQIGLAALPMLTRQRTPHFQSGGLAGCSNTRKSTRSAALTEWLAPQRLRERPRRALQAPSSPQRSYPRRLILRSNLWRTWNISDFPQCEE